MQNRALVKNAIRGGRRSRIVVLSELLILMMMMMGRGRGLGLGWRLLLRRWRMQCWRLSRTCHLRCGCVAVVVAIIATVVVRRRILGGVHFGTILSRTLKIWGIHLRRCRRGGRPSSQITGGI